MKKCSISNCNTKHYAKKMCKKHYTRMKRNGHVNYVGPQKKACEICGELGTFSGLCKKHYYQLVKKEYQRNYMRNKIKEKRKNDINFRILDNLRRRLYQAVKSKKVKTIDTLGCSIGELKQHLQAQFQPGMTWENYGRGGWHIDHIRPLSKFDLTNEKQLLIAGNYKNLQPLWAADNIRKSNKLLHEPK